MHRSYVLVLVFTLLLMTGCVDKRIAYHDAEMQEGKALVYVYRPDSFVNRAETMNIEFNGKEIGYLTSGGYRYALVDPGTLSIVLKKNVIPFNEYGAITLRDLEAGTSYYVKADPVAFGGFDMILMDQEQGKREASATGLYVTE